MAIKYIIPSYIEPRCTPTAAVGDAAMLLRSVELL
jgi:hypothetical protein